jgi:glycerophosphoryl diester phosphodiesterase
MITPQKHRGHEGYKPEAVAHRGASGYAPENTLAAFRRVLEMGVPFIEVDVHMSRDGELVVIHDPKVDRTTNGKGAVGDLTLTQLKKLDAGSWFNLSHPGKARMEFAGDRIPRLQEVIDLIKETKVGLYIEIKDPELYPQDFETRIISLLRRNEFEKKVVLLSFSANSLTKVRRLDSSIRTAFLASTSKTDPVSAAVSVGADGLAIRHTLLTPKILREARHKKLGIAVWTVDDENAIRRAVNLGADRIISNYPDLVMRLLLEYRSWGLG